MVIFIIIILYQFIPSIQIYIDESIDKLKQKSVKFQDFIDDQKFELNGNESFKEFNDKKNITHQEWGNPSKDGPSKTMPGNCWWVDSKLICKKYDVYNHLKM
jgi:hypothetical protein